MKAVALPTCTPNCTSLWQSLENSGYEVTAIVADGKSDEEQRQLVEQVRGIAPNFIIFFGAVPEHAPRRVLTIDTLRSLNSIAPLIHLCTDGGDEPWHPWLRRYASEGVFTLQANCDGCDAPECITTLTPFNDRCYDPIPWDQRDIRFGIVCSIVGHGQRQTFIDAMRSNYGLHVHETNASLSYSEFAQSMCRMKIIFNHGMRGSNQGQHLKGRVIEAGWAGSALFDHVDSPTSRWFEPGVEYFTYSSVEDVGRLLQMPDDVLRESAAKLHYRVNRDYAPPVIWNQILKSANVI